MTKDEMLELVKNQVPQNRDEFTEIPQGFSLTTTIRSFYYYYREGDVICILRLRHNEPPHFEIIHE